MLNGRNLNLGKRGITLGLLARLIRYQNLIFLFYEVCRLVTVCLLRKYVARNSQRGGMSTATIVVLEKEGRR